jgi:hypothetical protein
MVKILAYVDIEHPLTRTSGEQCRMEGDDCVRR